MMADREDNLVRSRLESLAGSEDYSASKRPLEHSRREDNLGERICKTLQLLNNACN